MEKMLWTALAMTWTLVFSAALYAAPIAQPLDVNNAKFADQPTSAIAISNLAVSPRLLPTRVLGGENTPEAIGLIIGTVLGFRHVVKRRRI